MKNQRCKVTLSAYLLMALFPLLHANTTIQFADSLRVEINPETKSIGILNGSELLLEIDSIRLDYIHPQALILKDTTHGKAVIELVYPSAVDYAHQADDTLPRIAELTIAQVEGGIRFHANPKWSEHTTLVLKDTGDHQFGLTEPLQPDNDLSPDLRGDVIDVEVKSDGETIVENYASAFSAFYMSSAGYGAFFDTFARGRYQFANSKGVHIIHHDTGELDWYVFPGTNGTQILKGYYQLIGAPKYVPIWALGPVLWRDENKGGAEEILDDANRFDELAIPATAWMVDRPYSDGGHKWSKMNFGAGFEHPELWLKELRSKHGVEFITWTATAFFGDARFHHHLDDWHTYLDLSDPESVVAFKEELARQQYTYGVKGHKMDRADEQFSAYSPWADSSVTEPFRRNKYVYLFAKVHDEALTQAWGKDQFSFARSAIHRTQPYLSGLWGGDPRSNWDGFRGNFANAMRAGFIGFPIWGSDVGGYIGDGRIPEDLYIRWLQAGSMSGLFEIKLDGSGGQGEDRVPWHYPESLQNEFRKVCNERMDLLPTLYSFANTSAHRGVLMQPMAYANLQDSNTWEIWDQYYFGDSILVAPVFSPDNRRSVYLPEGVWYDFDNPDIRYEGGQRITIDVPLEKYPRFVHENSMYLTGSIFRGSNRNWEKVPAMLTLHVFPGKKESHYVFDFVDPTDSDQEKPIKMLADADEARIHIPAQTHRLSVNWVCPQAVRQVEWNGNNIAVFDEPLAVGELEIPEASAGGELRLIY